MDIWMKRCQRKSKCHHCGEYVLKGEMMVVGKMWRKAGVALRFSYMFRWHPQCWIEQGKAAVENIPTPNRRRLTISDEDRKVRLLLLREWATLKFILMRYFTDQNYPRVQSTHAKMVEIKERIALVGGVPKKWEVVRE